MAEHMDTIFIMKLEQGHALRMKMMEEKRKQI